MTKTEHTPGPWHVNAIKAGRIVGDETSADFDKLQINNANATVATVYRAKDARLIAAAPELLEALKWALSKIPPPLERNKSNVEHVDSYQQARLVLERVNVQITFACPECSGRGGKYVAVCPHEHCRELATPWGCKDERSEWEPCPECLEGAIACAECNQEPATLIAEGGCYCEGCLSCPSCGACRLREPGECARCLRVKLVR